MSEPTKHLHAVPDTGELPDDAPQTLGEALEQIQDLRDQLAGAENNVRSMRGQMAQLKREIAGEVDREHQQFPQAVGLFRYWQEQCGHPKAEFTADRFKLLLPFLKRHKSDEIRKAIRGAAFDPFITTRKNQTKRRHDDWALIFQSEDKFQSFVARAPDWRPPTFSELSLMETAKDAAERVLERAQLIHESDDLAAVAHLLLEINRLIKRWQQNPTATSIDD